MPGTGGTFMNKKPLSRRSFSKLIAGSLFTGSVVEAAVQEQQRTGNLSDDTALILLDHLGYKPTLQDEMKTLKPMLETTIRNLQTIRDFQLPITGTRLRFTRKINP
jgi:hypothetical protein